MAPRPEAQEPTLSNGGHDQQPEWQQVYWASTEANRKKEDAARLEELKRRTAPTIEKNVALHEERARLYLQMQQIEQEIRGHDLAIEQAQLAFDKIQARLNQERRLEDEAKQVAFQQQRFGSQPQSQPQHEHQHQHQLQHPHLPPTASPNRDAHAMAARMGLPIHMGPSQGGQPGLNGHHPRGSNGSYTSSQNGDVIPQQPPQQHPQLRNVQNSSRDVVDLTYSPPAAPPADEVQPPEHAVTVHSSNGAGPQRPQPSQVLASNPAAPPPNGYKGSEKMGIQIYDGQGRFVGEVYSHELDYVWVFWLKNRVGRELPVQRYVQIRSDFRFTAADELETIYALTNTEHKASQWMACVIQAVGQIQEYPCNCCSGADGVFTECVKLDNNPHFNKCASCEWAGLGCDGGGEVATTGASSAQAPPPPITSGFKPVNASSAFTAVNEPRQGRRNDRKSLPDHLLGPSDLDSGTPAAKKPRKSLPTTRNASAAPVDGEDSKPQTPARPRGPRKKKDPNPDDVKDDETVQAEKEAKWKALGLDTISKETLLLRDDGTVYTEPELMRGVPLEKISADHLYWDPSWPSIEEAIRPVLEKWKERYQRHVDDVKLPTSSKFLAGRQVNRGKQVLEFLENGSLHPFQIVGKRWINKGLVNYDVCYRLVGILADLEKYKIDVEPHQWLRMRLDEIYEEKGDDFQLSKVVADLYHDPKIQGIRERSGFGSIGRPSGYNMLKRDDQAEGQKKPPRSRKRKAQPDTPGGSPQGRGPVNGQEQSADLGTEGVPSGEHAVQDEAEGQGQDTEMEMEMEMERLEEPQPEPEEPGRVTRSRPSSPRGPFHVRHALPGSAPRRSSSKATSNQQKKTKRDASQQPTNAHQNTVDPDLEPDPGYTSTDSFSGDKVSKMDWRVHQVKNKDYTTNTGVTQYWHWVMDKRLFEHQLLTVVNEDSAVWGVYQEPFDFHLKREEVVDVAWAPDSRTICITTKKIDGVEERGDVLVNFKRNRTKKRFLAFLRRKEVPLVKTTSGFIQDAWDAMQSPELPRNDDSGAD